MMMVGTRIKINDYVSRRYASRIGTITKLYGNDVVQVAFDDEPRGGTFYVRDLVVFEEPSILQNGYIRCKCGTITISNPLAMCCDCRPDPKWRGVVFGPGRTSSE